MKTVQIRHVPDEVHRKLKARAAMAGLSLSDYALRELRQIADRPTLDEMLDRLAALEPIHLPMSAADILREERDQR